MLPSPCGGDMAIMRTLDLTHSWTSMMGTQVLVDSMEIKAMVHEDKDYRVASSV